MKYAVVNLKTDPKLRKEAQILADGLGISLSTVINASLKQFVRERSITFAEDHVPTAELEVAIKEAEADHESGKLPKYSAKEVDEILADV